MRLILLAACLFALSACSSGSSFSERAREPLAQTERDSLFNDITTATRAGYGYTIEDPIRMGHFGLFKGIQASYEMISRLRKDGQPLRMIARASFHSDALADTNEVKPGPDLFRPGLAYVDRYSLMAANAQDTLYLFFDAYHIAPVRIPRGLAFAPIN